jgi:hypothetical protein
MSDTRDPAEQDVSTPSLQALPTRSYPVPPPGHAAVRWPVGSIAITVSGGQAFEGYGHIRRWTVRADLPGDVVPLDADADEVADIVARVDTREGVVSVAVMDAFSVDPRQDSAREVITSLDAVGGDALTIGDLLLGGGAASALFEDLTEASPFDPFLIVSTYQVVPEWRGTVLTPALAARMLEPFAALGVQSAALQAAPILTEDLDPARYTAAQWAIARMWATVGFRPLHKDGYMALGLDPTELDLVVQDAAQQLPDLRFI